MDELICPKCQGAGEQDHPCPFQEDVNGNESFTCNCCDSCKQECADDI